MLICSIALVSKETATDQVLLPTADKSSSPLALPPSLMDVASWSWHQRVVLETSINSIILALQQSCIIPLLHKVFLSLFCETISTLQIIPLL